MEREVFLNVRRPYLEETQAKQGVQNAKNQREIYQYLATTLSEYTYKHSTSKTLQDLIIAAGENVGSYFDSLDPIRGLLDLPGEKLRFLHAYNVDGFLEDFQKSAAVKFDAPIITAAIVAFLCETSAVQTQNIELDATAEGLDIRKLMAGYEAWKVQIHIAEQSRAETTRIAENFQDRIRTKLDEWGGEAKSLAMLVGMNEAERKNIVLASEQARIDFSSITKDLPAQAANLRDEFGKLSDLISALEERVRGNSTRQLWNRREKQSFWAFFLSAAVLGILLVIVPGIALYCHDSVIAFLNSVINASMAGLSDTTSSTEIAARALTRLVILSVPVALYLWLIRLVVRFNMRSMLLMDDARQRETMMNTYEFLLENSHASREERGLILNALFRPTPGHGTDNVDPPNFADLFTKNVKPE